MHRIDGYKIQCIILARSGGVGAGSASSLGKFRTSRRRSSLRLGLEMATVASSMGEAGGPIVIVAGSHHRHRLIRPDWASIVTGAGWAKLR